MTMNGMLFGMPELGHGRSRAINAENPTGEKGRGGMASSVLGKSRKGSPCLRNIKSGDTVVLADIKGCGVITHIWFTLFPKTTDADCFVFRDLVLRMYWDGEEAPSVEVPLGDFFCCGFGKECKVTSMPILVLPVRGFNSYFAMPFRTGAKITIENQHRNTVRRSSTRSTTTCMTRCRSTRSTSTRSGAGSRSRRRGRTTSSSTA